MGIRDTFNDFKPLTRFLLLLSFVGGLLLLIGFTLTDAGVDLTLWGWDPKPRWLKRYNADWLHSHAYIPNILAAVTGFLIGAPVALLVLAAFTVQREETQALKRVNSISLQAWNRFRDSVFELCSDERLEGLRVNADLVQRIHNDIYEEYRAYRERGMQTVPYQSGPIRGARQRGMNSEETDDFQRYLAANEEEFMAQINEVFNRVGNDHSFQVQWAGVRTNWTTVDQYVRLQRIERNLRWFNAAVDAELSHRLSDTVNPLTEFFDVHHVRKRHSNDSMLAARAVVLHDAQLPKEELDSKLLSGQSSGSLFGHQPVTNYYATALKVRGELEALKGAVLRVDREGWPAKFTAPETSN
jgi:hypothetical protein